MIAEPNFITRESAVLVKLAQGMRAYQDGHITGGELDTVIAECDDTSRAIEHERASNARFEAAERQRFRIAAARITRGEALAVLNGATGDLDVAYAAGERLRLRVDRGGAWA